MKQVLVLFVAACTAQFSVPAAPIYTPIASAPGYTYVPVAPYVAPVSYAASSTPVTTYTSGTILPAPLTAALTTTTTSKPVACNTQRDLDLVQCYGIASGCYIAQCLANGAWAPKQCGVYPCPAPNEAQPCPQCWCVDYTGAEIAGTRANATNAPVCAEATSLLKTEYFTPVRRRRVGGGGGGGGGLGIGVLFCLFGGCHGGNGGNPL